MGVKVLEVPGITVGFPGTVYFKSKGIFGVRVCWCAGGGWTGVERLDSSDCDSSFISHVLDPDNTAGLLKVAGDWVTVWLLLFNNAWSFAKSTEKKFINFF